MRTRLWSVLSVFFLLTLVEPRTAQAGIIELIDAWSGPGPFVGYGWEWRLACWTEHEPNAEDDKKRIIGVVGPGCFLTPGAVDPKKRRIASLNMGFGLYKSKENPLFDGDTTVVGERQFSTAVRLSTIELTAWWRPYRSLELGTGGGVMWIGGETFEPLRRVYFRPGVVAFKPIAALRDVDRSKTRPWGSMDEIVTLRLGLHVIPVGFTSADFGSTSGWRVAREVNWTGAIFFDLEPLFRKH